ncbi:MAG: hypothetical protein Q8N95_11765, partial [Desulfobacterales bacterium]|nr:hypothetical protein [Desulfobacterales bacterium]
RKGSKQAWSMKKRKLIIAERAIEDLMDIWLYIASDSIRNADRFMDSMKNASPFAIHQRLAENARNFYPGSVVCL